MNCSEIKPNLEAYALGALDPYTRTRVETHLESCAACRHTLASFREVVGELPNVLSNVSPLRPPSALQHKIMQAAQADIQARAIQETFAPRAIPSAPLAERGRGLLSLRPAMALLAVALVVVISSVGFWSLTQQMQQARLNEQQALAQKNDILRTSERALELASSLSKQDIVLHSPDSTSAVVGVVQLEPSNPTVVFRAYNLPAPGLGQSYFLWMVNKGTIQRVGQFAPGDNGFGLVTFLTDREDPVLKQLFVTLQSTTDLFPSSTHVLEWTADPNDSSEEFNPAPLSARPTVVMPGQ